MSLVSKLLRSLRTDGFSRTIARCFQYPGARRRREKLQRALSTRDPRIIFSTIHDSNLWSDQESVSGPGSSLEYTRNLREQLPKLLNRFGVKKLYDAPCGDFNWMRAVDLERYSVEYHGADVVSRIVEANHARFAGPLRRFEVADIISSPFPSADIWFCRDCLFHFSYGDIFRTLRNFIRSEIKYIFMTTHMPREGVQNIDVPTGEYRPLDFFSPPFRLPSDVLFRIVDYVEPFEPREMCLWSRQQIIDALERQGELTEFERRGPATAGSGGGAPRHQS